MLIYAILGLILCKMIPYAISEDLAQFQTINSSLMLREDGSANISLFDSNGSL